MLPRAGAPTTPPERRHSRPPAPSGEIRKYKGVRLRKWGRWVSEIRLPNSRERIWLGSYDTPEKAARAFDAAYVCLRGAGGADGLNFPGSPPDVVRRTCDPEEVHAAAVSHANGAAASPWNAAVPSEPTQAHHHGREPAMETTAAPAPAPALEQLQVPVESFDWSQLLLPDDLPPLFSPTEMGSHAYLPAAMMSLTAEDDVINMEENESGSFPELWSFDR